MNKLEFTKNNDNLIINDGFDLPKYTILVGKNNSGKSWLLREFAKKLEPKFLNQNLEKERKDLRARYISPERFGDFTRDTNYEESNLSNKLQRDFEKIKNQSVDFFKDAISAFNSLFNILRRFSSAGPSITCEDLIKKLNGKIEGLNFRLSTYEDQSGGLNFILNNSFGIPKNLSSGTMQIVSLMMYVLDFIYSGQYSKDSYLLIDEPDVHIHPDLQIAFIKFLIDVTKDTKYKILIATHSSSIVAGFKNTEDSYIGTIKNQELEFTKIDKITVELLPSLGAHSLSYVFNQSPLLMIEGDDDHIVWNHAIRKSQGKINFHLVDTGGKDNFVNYEEIVLKISPQLFDNPRVFEIRDADEDSSGELKKDLKDERFIKRSYLNCREIENLILSNEVLKTLSIDSWNEAKEKIDIDMKYKNLDRYKTKIDQEYGLISLLSDTNSKSWEQLVGEAIGKNIESINSLKNTEGSIYHMLGEKICTWIIDQSAVANMKVETKQ